METGLDRTPFTPRQLARHLDEHVTGHKVAKHKLARCIWWNQERRRLIASGVDPTSIRDKKNLLLAGPTGQGKTLSVKTAASAVGIPYYHTQATSYCAPGYKGMHVEEMIAGLARVSGSNLELASFGIVFIDEIDKIRIREKLQQSDVGAVAVQQALLAILGGTLVPTDAGLVDTSGITFVVAGAFQGLAVTPAQRHHLPSRNLIRFGFIPEFVGRFSSRVELTPLTADEMADVLLTSKSSPFCKMRNTLRLYNVGLRAEDEWVIEVVRRALQEDTGVRALNEIVDDQLGELDDILTQLPAGSEIVLTANGVIVPELNPPQDEENPFPLLGWTPSPSQLPALPPPSPRPRRRIESKPIAPVPEPPREEPAHPEWWQEIARSQAAGKSEPDQWSTLRQRSKSSAEKMGATMAEVWDQLLSLVKAHPVKIAALLLLAVMCGMYIAGAFNKNPGSSGPGIEKNDGRKRLFPELDYPPSR